MCYHVFVFSVRVGVLLAFLTGRQGQAMRLPVVEDDGARLIKQLARDGLPPSCAGQLASHCW